MLQDKLINYPVPEPMARSLQVQNFPLVICFKSFKMETRIQFLNVSEYKVFIDGIKSSSQPITN